MDAVNIFGKTRWRYDERTDLQKLRRTAAVSERDELMHEAGFPSLRIGNRLVVPKERFQIWMEGRLNR